MPITKQHLNAFIPTNLLDTLDRLLNLIQRLHAFLEERRLLGIYEVLNQSRTVTLHDPQGHLATVDTVQRMRFRQNYVAALLDYVWVIATSWRSTAARPGVAVDRYEEGTRYVVLISLGQKQSRGDELSFTSHRRVIDGFTRASECWES